MFSSDSQERKYEKEFFRFIDDPEDIFLPFIFSFVNTNWEEPIPPLTPKNVRDLRDACHRVYAQFCGIDLYPSPYQKAVQLLFSINKGHMLENGNKRVALCLFLFFCCIYHIDQHLILQEEAYDLSIDLARAPIEGRFKGLSDDEIKAQLLDTLFRK